MTKTMKILLIVMVFFVAGFLFRAGQEMNNGTITAWGAFTGVASMYLFIRVLLARGRGNAR